MYRVGDFNDYIDFAKAIGCKRIEEILIQPEDGAEVFQCHHNASSNPVLGYYFATDSHGIKHAFKHSVLGQGDILVDVTPTLDNRKYNIFAYGCIDIGEHITYLNNEVFINKNKQETEIIYYVYALIDPITKEPFYIGKGEDDRALSHFKETALEKEGNNRKTAKIKKLKSLGYEPMIEFYAQNIIDEDLAYYIQEKIVEKHKLQLESGVY
jgi:hypothetical protein